MWSKFKSFIGMATEVAPPPPAKVQGGGKAIPSMFRTAKPDATSQLLKTDRNTANTDLLSLRTASDTKTVIKNYSFVSPDISASVDAYIRTAVTSSYTAVAKNRDGSFNTEATKLVQQILTRIDLLSDYSDGFSGINSVRSVSEMMARELRLYGSCAMELVLDKSRLPRSFQPISSPSILFYPDKSGKWLAPKQLVSGEYIDLDYPTFFYVSLDQDLTSAYSASPMEPSIQSVLFYHEFFNDLRKVVKRAAFPRLKINLSTEELLKFVPAEAQGDEAKTKAWLNGIILDVQTSINGLAPEEALVMLDTMEASYMTLGSTAVDKEYTVLQAMADSKMATGTKTLPAILGHGSGSQNIASTETMLFMKNAEGAVQFKLNEIFSKALTLAVRLYGLDAYVEFKYATIDLRPDAELEAFRAQKQSRILEQLSLGLITDEEACLLLTGHLPPEGMTPLSGTFFKGNASMDTNSLAAAASNTGALNQSLKSDVTPLRRGGNGK